VAKHRQRCGRLYSNVVSTLDERQHPLVVSVSHEGIGDAMVGTEWGEEKARGTDDTFYVDQHGDLVEVEAGGGEEGLDEGGEGGAKASVGDTATWGTAYSLGDLEVAMRHYLDVRSEPGTIALSTLLAQMVPWFPNGSLVFSSSQILACFCPLSLLHVSTFHASLCLPPIAVCFLHASLLLCRALSLLTMFLDFLLPFSHPADHSLFFSGRISEGAVRRHPR
jgi:hypothetical protein